MSPNPTGTTTTATAATATAVIGAKRLVGAALIALAVVASSIVGPLGPQSAHASATGSATYSGITYAASGSWHAAVHAVAVTTASGATVRLPLHLYVPGAQHLDAARTAQVTHTTKPGARGGTDVEVTVRLAPAAGGRAFATNGAVRGVDVPDGEGLFVQRGGNSDRPLVFTFHLNRS